jgi:serine/tyrosine/threonine adenylyltransferase
MSTSALQSLSFDDHFVRSLPADPETTNGTRLVLGACYSSVAPTPVAAPRLVAASAEVLDLLGIPEEEAHGELFAQVFSGSRTLPGMKPYAACYGGHQFGSWAGQLGDGRAITLGELTGVDGGRWELQLKGAGPTPYSRRADGRAVLRSSVREFLCSEAMFHLGVPTTRALSLVTTGEPVLRDMFYDGNAQEEPGAVVCRVAPSFLRFGNFELFAARQDLETLRTLVDYTMGTWFPHLGPPSPASYAAFLDEVAQRTARLVVDWQRVGFVHGVMNTDNLSILGLTIDYGPYGWLEGYDPDWTPNTTDAQRGRYRFGMQPQVAGWNVARLAEALFPLIGEVEPLQAALEGYRDAVDHQLPVMLARKLGIVRYTPEHQPLVAELLRVLRLVETDYTLFFRGLARVRPSDDDAALLAPLADAFYVPPEAEHRRWIAAFVWTWLDAVDPDPARRQETMDAVNPKFVLRNWLAQLAIDRAAAGDPEGVRELLDVLRRPYDEQPGKEAYAARRPEWARHRAGCSMLSCSS